MSLKKILLGVYLRRQAAANFKEELGETMTKLIIPALLLTLAITGCSQSVPKCSDDETTDLVTQIADQEMGKQRGA